jgi:hypothetical protein
LFLDNPDLVAQACVAVFSLSDIDVGVRHRAVAKWPTARWNNCRYQQASQRSKQYVLPKATQRAEQQVRKLTRHGQLIRALYQPNPPETISKIQEVLHRLQRSPEGWQLAQSLITHREDNIRFYAALTLIIKLNRDRCVCAPCKNYQRHDVTEPQPLT